MHPLSKLVGFTVAIVSILGVMVLEGGHPVLLMQLPPLLLVLGLSFGGLLASHGPKLVWRTIAVALCSARSEPAEAAALQVVCRRGQRLAHAAGVVQVVLGAIHICSVLDNPSLIGPGIAYVLVGLVYSVLTAELGFGTMERWVGRLVDPAVVPSVPE